RLTYQTRSPSAYFHEPATTDIYTLSLHDALPILGHQGGLAGRVVQDPRGHRAVQTEQEHRSVHEGHIATAEHPVVAGAHFGGIGVARDVTPRVRDVGHGRLLRWQS